MTLQWSFAPLLTSSKAKAELAACFGRWPMAGPPQRGPGRDVWGGWIKEYVYIYIDMYMCVYLNVYVYICMQIYAYRSPRHVHTHSFGCFYKLGVRCPCNKNHTI